jgi:probable HAF family extracellular repeat protein
MMPSHALISLVVAIVLALPFSEVAAQRPGYTVTDLGTLGGAESEAYAINERGEVAGWAETAAGVRRAFLYREGRLAELDPLPGFTESEAFGINDRGQVAGAAAGDREVRTADTGQRPEGTLGKSRIRRAVLWAGGKAREIGPGEGRDVNNAGQVVYQSAPNGEGFLWQDGKEPVPLTGDLPRAAARVYAISESGTVVGELSVDGDRAPFTWKGSRFSLLASPVRGPFHAEARAINGKGQVVGIGSAKDGEACLWADGEATYLGTLNGEFMVGALGQHAGYHHSAAYGINDRGQIVGAANVSDRGLRDLRAFLWENGRLLDLNRLIDGRSGWILEEGRAINNRGQICGSGSRNGRRRAFLLTPAG